MAIELTDDGTLDTVLRCSDCGEKTRYNYDVGPESEERALELRAEYLLENPGATDSAANEHADTTLYEEWIAGCIEDASSEHVCQSDEDEPQDDDITTSDHRTFYQAGRLVLEQSELQNARYYGGSREYLATWFYYDRGRRLLGSFGDDHAAALRAYMERTQYWSNCWFIADHGNAHLMDLSEGK